MREKFHYDKIWKKEVVLCNLRKNCQQNLKFVSDVEGNALLEDTSISECGGYQVSERYFQE